MDDRTVKCIAAGVALVLAAILRWVWITPQRFPAIGVRRWPREFFSYSIACFVVAVAFGVLALFATGAPNRFLPALLFAELGITALYFFSISNSIPSQGSGRRSAIQNGWFRMLGTVCLGFAIIFLPRHLDAALPPFLSNGVGAFSFMVSIALCWYSYQFREHLSRIMLMTGFLPFLLPLLLGLWLRQRG